MADGGLLSGRDLAVPRPSRALGIVAVVLAALALLVSVFALSRVVGLVRAHNDLVAKWNSYQAHRQKQSSGAGALLEAAGVPGGRIIGDVLDASRLTPEEQAARDRSGRR